MPRAHRLSRADFERLKRVRGTRIHGEYFSLLRAPLPDGQGPKAACVVSKKISPKATVRNKIERRAREAMRPLLRGRTDAIAYVLYPKKEAVTASLESVKKDISRLFARE